MPDGVKWKNVREHTAFNRLHDLLSVLKPFGLEDTAEALETLLNGRTECGRWNWSLFEHIVNRLVSEFGDQDPTYADGFAILNEVLGQTFKTKRRKGKLTDPFEVAWSSEDSAHLATTLGLVMKTAEEALKSGEVDTAILLAGLGHIVRYEVRGDFVRRRIKAWAQPWMRTEREAATRDLLIDRFLVLKTTGTGGKPDTFHIRNAFAHAHFDVHDPNRIDVWDTDEKGNRTFSLTLNALDLFNLSNMFEKKLKIVEMYPSLLVAIQDLYGVYRREWRLFRSP